MNKAILVDIYIYHTLCLRYDDQMNGRKMNGRKKLQDLLHHQDKMTKQVETCADYYK